MPNGEISPAQPESVSLPWSCEMPWTAPETPAGDEQHGDDRRHPHAPPRREGRDQQPHRREHHREQHRAGQPGQQVAGAGPAAAAGEQGTGVQHQQRHGEQHEDRRRHRRQLGLHVPVPRQRPGEVQRHDPEPQVARDALRRLARHEDHHDEPPGARRTTCTPRGISSALPRTTTADHDQRRAAVIDREQQQRHHLGPRAATQSVGAAQALRRPASAGRTPGRAAARRSGGSRCRGSRRSRAACVRPAPAGPAAPGRGRCPACGGVLAAAGPGRPRARRPRRGPGRRSCRRRSPARAIAPARRTVTPGGGQRGRPPRRRRSLTSTVSCWVAAVTSAVAAARISRPPSITTTWSQTRSSSPSRCEVTSTEMPNSCRSAGSGRACRRDRPGPGRWSARPAAPAAGSCTRAWASLTRCFMPVE